LAFDDLFAKWGLISFCGMGLAKGEIELYSAFRQLCSGLSPFFFFHFGNKALFLPFASLISIMGELYFW
jgi:hypothetical protein